MRSIAGGSELLAGGESRGDDSRRPNGLAAAPVGLGGRSDQHRLNPHRARTRIVRIQPDRRGGRPLTHVPVDLDAVDISGVSSASGQRIGKGIDLQSNSLESIVATRYSRYGLSPAGFMQMRSAESGIQLLSHEQIA